MAVMTLNPLVLRGVTVVTGGKAVDTRRGLGYRAMVHAPALVSMRHPSPGNPAEPNPDEQRRAQLQRGGAVRAGRPGCRAGFLVSRSPAFPAGRAALSWPSTQGGLRPSAASCLGFTKAGATASVDDIVPDSASTRGMRAHGL